MNASPGRASAPVAASSPAVVISASPENTRTMPSRSQTAENTRSSPISEPVCAIATAPASSLRPIFSMTIGLACASARVQAATNAAGSRMVSANTAIARVCGSSTR